MVLVPGDPADGIAPFYVQTTEVTWEMFRAWSYCEDVANDAHSAALRTAEKRLEQQRAKLAAEQQLAAMSVTDRADARSVIESMKLPDTRRTELLKATR